MLQKINFIATKYGLKRLMRGSFSTMEEFLKISQFCRSQGLFAFRSKTKIKNPALDGEGKAFHVYISKDKKIAKRFSEQDPDYSELPGKGKTKYFAKMLGYPECCIDSFLNLECGNYNENIKKEILFKKILKKKKSFLLNNFLYGLDFSLSFYQPCSYSCKAAMDYNKKILEAVRKEDPYFAIKIEKYLRLPLLVWFDTSPESDMNNFFHNRIQLFFKGHICNSNIYYNEVILCKKYPQCNLSFQENRLGEFFLGNKCKIDNNNIKIFYKNKTLKEIKISSRYHGVLIKFS